MKRIRALFDQRREHVASHPFFAWLGSSSVPLAKRFVFTPVMVDFTMGFADMNKWFLSYADPASDFERAINQHTAEDRTHSRLFVENWRAFKLDAQLNWPPSKVLWWLYHSGETLPIREFGWEIMRLAVRFPDPLVRFALMEAIETCGDVFFRNTARVATALSQQTGTEYRYYGEYHQARETGHLHTDESPFFGSALSQLQYEQAEQSVTRIFDGFERVLDKVLSYSNRAAEQPEQLERLIHAQYERAMLKPLALTLNRSLRAPCDGVVAPSQAPLVDHLSERKAQLGRHPFLVWLKESPLSAGDKLRSFTALWATDIAGYPDFLTFALSYPKADNEEQQAINALARSLSSHGILYLQDWQALGLDELLAWAPGETIGFYFLAEQTESHRRNLAQVTRYAAKDESALARLWLITAFETGGDLLFDALAPLVAVAERDGEPLNYWAERHFSAGSTLTTQAHTTLAQLLTQPISTAQQHEVSAMISTLFDNFEQQMTLSLQHAAARAFLNQPGSLPPVPADAPQFPRCTPAELLVAK